MIATVLTIENIFPEEPDFEYLNYLKRIEKNVLIHLISFINLKDGLDISNIVSDYKINQEVQAKINTIKYEDDKQVFLFNEYTKIKLAEIVLSNQKKLNEDSDLPVFEQELLLLKIILKINSEYYLEIEKPLLTKHIRNFKEFEEEVINQYILTQFQVFELGLKENKLYELLKLSYCTIYKLQYLLKFLEQNEVLGNLNLELLKFFNQKSNNDFVIEAKKAFGLIINAYHKNNYKFKISEGSLKILNSFIIDDLEIEDNDFTSIKKKPVLFYNQTDFSIINFFLFIDLFTRFLKFKIKELYEALEIDKTHKLGTFFSYFPKKFSEEYLSEKILNDIFSKPYYYKIQKTGTERKNEPDFYVRYQNTIFLFEIKDLFINSKVKSSKSLDEILGEFNKKFVGKNQDVGIMQLIKHIELINNKKFQFDHLSNIKNNIKIYPIILVHDRILQAPGINLKLNKIFKIEASKITTSHVIKDLVIMDIDTLISIIDDIKDNHKAFIKHLDYHIKCMNSSKNLENFSQVESKREQQFTKYIINKSLPFSNRIQAKIHKHKIISMFLNKTIKTTPQKQDGQTQLKNQ